MQKTSMTMTAALVAAMGAIVFTAPQALANIVPIGADAAVAAVQAIAPELLEETSYDAQTARVVAPGATPALPRK